MKKLRKIAAMLTVMVMVFVLAGCGGKKVDVSGEYRATYNLKDMINQQLAASGLAMNSDMNAEFVLQLTPEGTFTFDMDAEGFQKKFTAALQKEGPEIMRTMLEQEGISEDMYETIAAASGYDSYDAFVNGMMEDVMAEAGNGLADQVNNAVHCAGTYTVDKNSLTLTADTGTGQGIDKGTVNEDGTITITAMPADGTTITLTFIK